MRSTVYPFGRSQCSEFPGRDCTYHQFAVGFCKEILRTWFRSQKFPGTLELVRTNGQPRAIVGQAVAKQRKPIRSRVSPRPLPLVGGRVGERIATVTRTYLVSIPLLWATGLVTPVGGLVVCWASLRSGVSSVLFDPVALPWLFVGVAQSLSVLLNWLQSGLPISQLIYRLLSTGVTGWLVLGVSLGIGRHLNAYTEKIVRGIAILGLHLFAFSLLSFVLSRMIQAESLGLVTPLAFLMPDSLPAKELYFSIRFFYWGESIIPSLPRLVLFYPWSVMLGFAGVSVFFVAISENILRWRFFGCCGGLCAVIGSQSRASMIVFVIGLFVYYFSRKSGLSLLLFLSFGFTASLVGLISSQWVANFISSSSQSVVESREGSSEARQIGYEESWEAFKLSPAFGYGWPGEYVSETIPMPLGSHSTFYGLLYTGGVVTFSCFLIAMLNLLIRVFRRGIYGSSDERAALVIVISLVFFSYVEGIYSFAIPLFYVFFFIGTTMDEKRAMSSLRDTDVNQILEGTGTTRIRRS